MTALCVVGLAAAAYSSESAEPAESRPERGVNVLRYSGYDVVVKNRDMVMADIEEPYEHQAARSRGGTPRPDSYAWTAESGAFGGTSGRAQLAPLVERARPPQQAAERRDSSLLDDLASALSGPEPTGMERDLISRWGWLAEMADEQRSPMGPGSEPQRYPAPIQERLGGLSVQGSRRTDAAARTSPLWDAGTEPGMDFAVGEGFTSGRRLEREPQGSQFSPGQQLGEDGSGRFERRQTGGFRTRPSARELHDAQSQRFTGHR